ncbi:MAG: cytochrome bd-I oxidase subunit CydX [Methylococcaceae bacterium]|jgi:cyd operon protein YbgT
MWYFAWILGVGFASAFAIINAMWLESVCDIDTHGIDDCLLEQKEQEPEQ